MSAQQSRDRKRVLIVAANAAVSKQTGAPIGFWWAELTHPYSVFVEAGCEVEIRSPDGGALTPDSYSDPEDPSGYSAHDLVSLGFKKSAAHAALIQNTRSLDGVEPGAYDAIFVIGGQSPMYTFRGNTGLAKLVASFHDAGKPTALVCHGTCVLLEARSATGKLLVEGKTWTGFASSEEAIADSIVGRRIQPFWIEAEARKIAGTRFVVAEPFRPFAVRDGHLVTGQQQNSGKAAAQLVVRLLDSPEQPADVEMVGSGIDVARFTHPFFEANAWLVMNASHAILVDTASNGSADADRVCDFVRRSGRELQAVVLSHGHPDIWLGVKALSEAFPRARIYASSAEILDDIVAMGNLLDQVGMLTDAELSPRNFDYRKAIRVLDGNTLTLEGAPSATLHVWQTDEPSEHTRIATFSVPELNALLVSDLAYNHVHSWGGTGVDRKAIENWIRYLDRLIRAHGTVGVRILPGHGPATDANLLHAQRAYLRDLLDVVDSSVDDDAAVAAMLERYPGHRGRDFQLAMTMQNRAALSAPGGQRSRRGRWW